MSNKVSIQQLQDQLPELLDQVVKVPADGTGVRLMVRESGCGASGIGKASMRDQRNEMC